MHPLAAIHVEKCTQTAAIKVSSIVGTVFCHKDWKHGQQDTLWYFWDLEMSFILCFPDTSNTHFQSHTESYAIIIAYLDLILQFLSYVEQNKASQTLNHIEHNVKYGCEDNVLQHEFAIITIYYEVIGVPYMCEIHGPL